VNSEDAGKIGGIFVSQLAGLPVEENTRINARKK